MGFIELIWDLFGIYGIYLRFIWNLCGFYGSVRNDLPLELLQRTNGLQYQSISKIHIFANSASQPTKSSKTHLYTQKETEVEIPGL